MTRKIGSVSYADSAKIDIIDTVVDRIEVDTTSIEAKVDIVDTVVDNISSDLTDLGNSILTLTESGGTLTTDGTEQTVYIADSPSGLFSPLSFLMDFTNHTAGETVVLRVYYKIKSGGNYIKNIESTYAGAQDPNLINLALLDNRFGIKITAEKTGGTNRDYDWEVIYKG